MKKAILIILAVLIFCYGALETVVLVGCRDDEPRDAPVMIVLGCMVWPDGPSPALTRRLDKALDYWRSHPEVTIVVSGGQGANEPMSEARAMFDYLTARGVPEAQILLEDTSTSTKENLLYAKAVLEGAGYDLSETPVVIVSNDFHLARVRMLSGRCGLDAVALGAPMPDFFSAFYSYNREVFALVKSFLFD